MTNKVEVNYQGKRSLKRYYEIDSIPIFINGRFFKIARVAEEWLYNVKRPDFIIKELRELRPKIDLFAFRQIVPYSRPKFSYYYEWENNAVVHIKSYEHWLKNQLHENSRNKIRIAEKKGVKVKQCEFNDDFVKKMIEIYNETPIRQGKRYSRYGADFDTLKKASSTFLEQSLFLGAFYNDELIGFVKLVNAGSFVRTMGILAKIKHHDKAPMNILISKAVEKCAEMGTEYFVYGEFDYGKVGSDSIKDFKRYNGFEGILLPRYYCPLTLKGKIFMKLNFHHGLTGLIPRPIIRIFINMRKFYYERTNKYLTKNLQQTK